jgi:hypothetical protein
LGDVVQKRIDKLFIGLDRIHICSVGLSANKKLSRGNATIDCRSVRVDGISSHWFITRAHVQGRIQRLVSFLEYSTYGHACKLSSMLKRLLDGINRQPTKMRAKLSVVRFRSHDELRSGLHCLMVTNITCMISTVDNEVNDAIWVIRKLLQGIVKLVIIKTWLGVECIEVVNLPLALVNKNTSMELPILIIQGVQKFRNFTKLKLVETPQTPISLKPSIHEVSEYT